MVRGDDENRSICSPLCEATPRWSRKLHALSALFEQYSNGLIRERFLKLTGQSSEWDTASDTGNNHAGNT